MFEGIGNIGTYTKMQMMKQRARKNISNGFTLGKNDTNQQDWNGLSLSKVSVNKNANSNKNTFKLKLIKIKMGRGKKLSDDELEYLRQNASDLYAKAVRINQDREELERRLKNCKTKEEARQVQRSFISTANTPELPSSGNAGGVTGGGECAGAALPSGNAAPVAASAESAPPTAIASAPADTAATVNPAVSAYSAVNLTTGQSALFNNNTSDNDIDLPESILRQRAMDDAWFQYAKTKKYRDLAETEAERKERKKHRKISIQI